MRSIAVAVSTVVLVLSAGVSAGENTQSVIRTGLGDSVLAPSMNEALVLGVNEVHYRLVTWKDPTLAAILSIGTPGLGQVYTGRWRRGAAFFGGVVGCLVVSGLAGDELDLSPEDFDTPDRGGNGNGEVDLAEYLEWDDNRYRDFSEISTGRKAAVIGGLTGALALYVWNVIDAHSCAEEYNRNLYGELSRMNLSVGATPDGRTFRGQVSFGL